MCNDIILAGQASSAFQALCNLRQEYLDRKKQKQEDINDNEHTITLLPDADETMVCASYDLMINAISSSHLWHCLFVDKLHLFRQNISSQKLGQNQ